MARTSATTSSTNEGEGNKTAAREYNDAQQRFVNSGQVDEKAREAERALDGPERRELEAAEAIGKSHAAGEDPQVAGANERRYGSVPIKFGKAKADLMAGTATTGSRRSGKWRMTKPNPALAIPR